MPRRRLNPWPPLVALLAGAVLSTGAALPATADPLDDLTPLGGGQQQRQQPPPDRTFKVATLNILGSQHTRGGDHERTVRTARQLKEHRVLLAGLQEVQQDQHRWLRDRMPGYRIWPGMRYGPQGIRLQIAWHRKRFALRDHGTITTTFSNQQRPIPWVRLRDRETGRTLSVIDIHNSPTYQESARDAATREEIRLYRDLRRRGPVLLTGDANEHGEFFCKVTGGTDARAANGGSHRGACRPPRPTYVDWVLGSGPFRWERYRSRETSTSDHRLHTAVLEWSGERHR